MLNPYKSVVDIFPEVIDDLKSENGRYLGIKANANINMEKIYALTSYEYYIHTIDKSSPNGRAIDPFLINPVSLKPMTGSSSGTAINVFIGINDVGIGTDGGGSVLAPAISLNLYGFISPLLPFVDKVAKTSTDNIPFTPSSGIISKNLSEIEKIVRIAINLPSYNDLELNDTKLLLVNDSNKYSDKFSMVKHIETKEIDIYTNRRELISWLNGELNKVDIVIAPEGPIDLFGMGDTLFGHFDELTASNQRMSNKGLLRVVNMTRATALSIPNSSFASGTLLICRSIPKSISSLFYLASLLPSYKDELINNYFSQLNTYKNNVAKNH